MESLAALKPTTASLRARKVPFIPVAVNATALLAVNTLLVSRAEIDPSLKLPRLPTEVVRVVTKLEVEASI